MLSIARTAAAHATLSAAVSFAASGADDAIAIVSAMVFEQQKEQKWEQNRCRNES